MSASPAASHASAGVELELAGLRGFGVVGLAIDERVSGRTSARVEITSSEDLPFEAAVGEPAKLTLHRANDSGIAQRVWTLDFAEAVFLEHKNRGFRYELTLVDPMWKLGLGRATRKFRNLSATAIVSAVLGEAGVRHRFELAGPSLPVKKYCAQYREDNLTFVERLMELEGIYYRLDEDGTVVFGDASGSADLIAGGRIFELVEAANALRSASADAVFELRRGARVMSGRVTLGDYNWKKPSVPLRAMGSGDAETYLERFQYPAGYRDPDRGARLAQRRVEAYRAQAHFLEGKGNILPLAPGKGIRIGSLIGYAFSGEYFTTSVRHRLTRVAYAEDGALPDLTYENRFEGIPRSVPFRPLPRAPRPTVAGSHTAMVRGPSGSEIHTDKYGRFRAQLHWDRDATGTDEDSRWLRALQETSSSMVLARTGWEVFIGYIDGDPDRPIGLGRAINGIAPPTYGLPANKNAMTIHTPSSPATGGYSEIKMDDSAGAQKISIRAEKDLDTVVKNDKLEKVGHDETHEVGLHLKRTVAGDQTITIGGHDVSRFDAAEELRVGGDRKVTVGGSETIDVDGALSLTFGQSHSEKVGSMRISLVGSPKAPDFKGMAKAAVNGLIPAQVKQLQGLVEGGTDGVTNILTGAANAAGASLASGGGWQGAQAAAGGSIANQIGLGSSSTGGLPSLGDLAQQYSASNLTGQLQTQFQGALSTATGGLSGMFFTPGQGQGDRRGIQLGWDQADTLVNLLASGGISRAATKSIRKIVGGAYVMAAVGPIGWGAAAAWLETIGGLKMTSTPRNISQNVDGRLQLTVGGKVLRGALVKISVMAKKSSIQVGGLAKHLAVKTLDWEGVASVAAEAATKLTLTGGKSSTLKLEPGGTTIECKKLGIETTGELILNGKKLDLAKSG